MREARAARRLQAFLRRSTVLAAWHRSVAAKEEALYMYMCIRMFTLVCMYTCRCQMRLQPSLKKTPELCCIMQEILC